MYLTFYRFYRKNRWYLFQWGAQTRTQCENTSPRHHFSFNNATKRLGMWKISLVNCKTHFKRIHQGVGIMLIVATHSIFALTLYLYKSSLRNIFSHARRGKRKNSNTTILLVDAQLQTNKLVCNDGILNAGHEGAFQKHMT